MNEGDFTKCTYGLSPNPNSVRYLQGKSLRAGKMQRQWEIFFLINSELFNVDVTEIVFVIEGIIHD